MKTKFPARTGGMISFATSRPAAEMFPIEEIRQTIAEVTASDDLAVDGIQMD